MEYCAVSTLECRMVDVHDLLEYAYGDVLHRLRVMHPGCSALRARTALMAEWAHRQLGYSL